MTIEETKWFQTLKKFDCIMIFGAKFNAHFTYELIKQSGTDIECFLVSERQDNPRNLDNKPVKLFNEVNEKAKQNCLVVISQLYENNDEMKRVLYAFGFKNVISSATQGIFALDAGTQKYCRSILKNMQIVENVGEDHVHRDKGAENLRVYAVTSHKNLHKSKRLYQSKYIKYIQAGAELTDIRVGELVDNIGEHVSDLNPYYCELTAGYWIWKNDNIHEFVGLYHYSRGLDVTDGQLEAIVKQGIDVLLPVPIVYRHEMITRYVPYMDFIFQALDRTSREYMYSAEKFFSEKLFFAGNIVFCRKEIFNQYYEWMWKILSECQTIKEEHGEMVMPRLWGYCGEVLTNIFFMHHMDEYKIMYARVRDMY